MESLFVQDGSQTRTPLTRPSAGLQTPGPTSSCKSTSKGAHTLERRDASRRIQQRAHLLITEEPEHVHGDEKHRHHTPTLRLIEVGAAMVSLRGSSDRPTQPDKREWQVRGVEQLWPTSYFRLAFQ